ncbi:MAG TPA: dienelactone hydrolase family protein [Blastocatellia bacterium]|nr:dienelactone hydrolase family protein [Blastocatellia bacterium]
MKYVVVFLYILSSLNGAAPKDAITKETVLSGGKTRGYYLFIPDKLDETRRAPLIVMLHGSGRNGRILLDHWKDLANQEGIVLAGPDSQNPMAWRTPEDGPEFLRDVVEAVKGRAFINPRRVYLFGHSGGAVFGIAMSLFESEYFAAAAVSAGALEPDRVGSFGEVAQRKVPIAIFVGTQDRSFPLDLVRKTRDGLNAKGLNVQLTEIPGHDHNYYSRSTEINRSAWEFLKKVELASDPKYAAYDFKRK